MCEELTGDLFGGVEGPNSPGAFRFLSPSFDNEDREGKGTEGELDDDSDYAY